jgi:hypothetical protein
MIVERARPAGRAKLGVMMVVLVQGANHFHVVAHFKIHRVVTSVKLAVGIVGIEGPPIVGGHIRQRCDIFFFDPTERSWTTPLIGSAETTIRTSAVPGIELNMYSNGIIAIFIHREPESINVDVAQSDG